MSVVSGGSSCLYAFSHYKGAAADATPLVFVGKGITFDSGGISIKPSSVSLSEFLAPLTPTERNIA
jgi:leucyl aminopeptidase